MSLQLDLKEKMKDAMRAKDSVRLAVVRAIIAGISNESLSLGKGPSGELSDEEVLAVIRKEAKKRKDSIEQYTGGGRPELAESEQAELNILSEFLPALMSAEQIKPIVERKLAELEEAGSPRGVALRGKLMGIIMKELGAKADGTVVKQVVESLLQ